MHKVHIAEDMTYRNRFFCLAHCQGFDNFSLTILSEKDFLQLNSTVNLGFSKYLTLI